MRKCILVLMVCFSNNLWSSTLEDLVIHKKQLIENNIRDINNNIGYLRTRVNKDIRKIKMMKIEVNHSSNFMLEVIRSDLKRTSGRIHSNLEKIEFLKLELKKLKKSGDKS